MNDVDRVQGFVQGYQHDQRQRAEDAFFGAMIASFVFSLIGRLFSRRS